MTSNSYSPSSYQPALQLGGKSISRTQTAWGSYGLFLALYAWVFSQWQIQAVPASVHALGVLVAAICTFLLALWSARGSREIPAFELICVAYLAALPLAPAYDNLLFADQTDEHQEFFEKCREADSSSSKEEFVDEVEFYLSKEAVRGRLRALLSFPTLLTATVRRKF